MPTFMLPQMAPMGLLLLGAAMALMYGLIRGCDVARQMYDATRNRSVRDAELIDQATAEVRR